MSEKEHSTTTPITDEEIAHIVALDAYHEHQKALDEMVNSDEYEAPDMNQAAQFQAKLHKAAQPAHKKSRLFHLPRRSAAAIAAVAVFVFAAIPAAAYYTNFFDVITNFFEDHGVVDTLDGQKFTKPDGWDSEFYPTWIPDGYELVEVTNTFYSSVLYFENSDGHEFNFTICFSENEQQINTEDVEEFEINIQGKAHMAYKSPDGTHCMIVIGTTAGNLIVDGSLSEAEFIKIVKSINNLQ